jgi:hypothetical protein
MYEISAQNHFHRASGIVQEKPECGRKSQSDRVGAEHLNMTTKRYISWKLGF